MDQTRDSNEERKQSLKSNVLERVATPVPRESKKRVSIISYGGSLGKEVPEGLAPLENDGPMDLGRGYSKDEEEGKISNLATSDVLVVFRSVIMSLKVVGLWPREEEKFFKKFNPQSWFVFTYLHVYAVHNICNWFFSYYRSTSGGFHIFLENASMVIRTGTTALTFDLFFMQSREIMKSLVMVSYYPFSNSSITLISLKTPIMTLVAASWVYLGVILGVQSWSTATMGVQKFMDYYFYGFKAGHVNAVLMRFLMAGVWVAHISITLAAEIFLKTFYVASCFLLAQTARAYNQMVASVERKDVISGDDINRINKLHTRLSDLVIGVDKNFSANALVWVATIFMNLCIKIGIICITTDPSWMTNASLDIINYMIIFIVITLTAAEVSLQCEVLLPMAHKLAAKAEMKDLTVLYQAKLMIAKMSHPVAQLTGWRCFVLDRPFILTVISTILTYSVVLMQMSGPPGSPGAARTGYFNRLFNQSYVELTTEV